MLTMLLLLFCLHLQAQNLNVTGRVLDQATGLAVPNATVTVVGLSNATSTDEKGFFSIQVSRATAKLSVASMGYSTKIVSLTDASSTIVVELSPEIGNLEEVVVVGYGTQKRATVTGAISSVKASDLENMPVNRIEQSLQGRTSGVVVTANSGQPGSAAAVRVRGITTLNNNNPLWVVDGVVVDNGGIGFLNQSDIESIEVLKDAAAQAIYGARAANGVILVSTKKGKSGDPRIAYNGFFGISAPDKKLNLLNASQYVMLRNEARKNDGESPMFDETDGFGEGTDWQDEIFNNSAQRHNHEFSISGGTEKTTYYSSFGYFNQEGIVATDISKYNRLNFRLNSTYKPATWITIGENIGYSRDKSIGLGNTNSEYGGPLSSAINLDPLTPVIITDQGIASKSPYTNDNIIRDSFGNPYGISAYVAQEMSNPLAYIQTRNGNYGWSDNIVGNAFAEINPIDGLKWRTTLGTKLSFWGSESFTPPFYLNAASINSRTNFSRNMNRSMAWNVENTLSYQKKINEHQITLLLGQGAYVDNNSYGINGTYFGIPALGFQDASMNFNIPNTDKNLGGNEGVLNKVSSLFARINYNYQDKYLLEALVRRDGSSKFGPKHKYGVFPSFSAGWILSSEEFWNKETNPISFLKLRGGYGVVGNDNIGNFGYTSIIGSGRNYAFGTEDGYLVGYSPNSVPNPDLKWEETASTSIGLDAIFFQRFNLTLDWYSKKTKDILQQIPIPSYVGVVSDPATNIASMKNHGVELEVGYTDKFGEWDFRASGNVTYLENEVLELGQGRQFLSNNQQNFQSSSYPIARTEVGQSMYTFYGFQHLGIFQNQQEIDNYLDKDGNKIQPNAKPGDFKWQDTNENGSIDEDDRVILGSPIPKWTFGITLNTAYKGFDFMLFGQGVAGNKIFQGLRRLDIANANWQTTALDRWTGEGSSNDFPRMSDADDNKNFRNPSNFYLENGAYFRLKVAQLGYTFKNFAPKFGAKNLRVYLMAENLFTITKYTGYDPEIGGNESNSGMGIDRGIYPQARSFMVGLNLGF